ncbi:3'-5' exonuclease [Prescottella equi]|uniref:3'-5' exonuclease n=1 Tax=Rhodococcus hoagii TaxID=43767 RepID=UPI0007CD68B0|nr:exonuclease domain-containing protein [Prescottella equi]
MIPIVFVDTETTSLHPETRRPWEIALIRRDDHGEREFLFQIEDPDLSAADPFSLKIGKFYERHETDSMASDVRHPYDGVQRKTDTEACVALQVEEITAGAHLVAVNVAFDADVLDRMLRRARRMPRWDYHLLDMPAMAIGYLAGLAAHGHSNPACSMSDIPCVDDPVALPYRSYELSERCGVDRPAEDEQHTALGDARWVARWWDAIAPRAIALDGARVE